MTQYYALLNIIVLRHTRSKKRVGLFACGP